MIERVYAVIGAGYGDEGKGLWTNHLCYKIIQEGYKLNPPKFNIKPLVVLCNGGSQRGHTVVEGSITHVFHHFGSGTLASVPTLFAKDFVLNPLIFRTEYEELEPIMIKKTTANTIKVYADKDCKVTTPFDMLLNQYQMENDCAHNSCGVGIWETINRYENDDAIYSKYTIKDYKEMFDNREYNKLYMVLDELRYSMEKEIRERKLNLSPSEIRFINAHINDIKTNFINELEYMIDRIEIVEDYSTLNKFTDLIFEMGQGLALDKDKEDSNYSTPSNTGVVNLLRILPNFNFKVDVDFINRSVVNCDVYYVTRAYATRHGEGKFKEFDKDSKFRQFVLDNEKTNVYNSCQGEFRVGPLDFDELSLRINKDFWDTINYGLEVTKDNLDLIKTMSDDCLREIKAGPLSEIKRGEGNRFHMDPPSAMINFRKHVVITHMDEISGFEKELGDDYVDNLYNFEDNPELVLGRESKNVF